MPVKINRTPNPAILDELLGGAKSTAFLKGISPQTPPGSNKNGEQQVVPPASSVREP